MRNSKKRILLSLVFITLAMSFFAGCVSAPARGGSGPEIVNGVIYISSSEGHVFALNPQSRKDNAAFPSSGEWVFPPDRELGPLYASPYVDNGTVYAATMIGRPATLFQFVGPPRFDAYIYFLDPATGMKRLEAIPMETEDLAISSPVADRETLFVAVGSRVFALDKTTGKQRWQKPFEAGGKVWSNLVFSDNTLYFGSLDHNVYALNTNTGELRWPPFATNSAIAATPLIVGDTLYIGSFDKGFYAIDSATGKPRWSAPFQGDGWFWARAIEDKGRIYVGNMAGKVYAIDSKNGKMAWSSPFEAQSAIRSSPVVIDGVLIIASTNGQIYGLNAETGKMQWPVPYKVGGEVVTDLAAAGNIVYIHTADGTLYGLEAATGSAKLTFPVKFTPKK